MCLTNELVVSEQSVVWSLTGCGSQPSTPGSSEPVTWKQLLFGFSNFKHVQHFQQLMSCKKERKICKKEKVVKVPKCSGDSLWHKTPCLPKNISSKNLFSCPIRCWSGRPSATMWGQFCLTSQPQLAINTQKLAPPKKGNYKHLFIMKQTNKVNCIVWNSLNWILSCNP